MFIKRGATTEGEVKHVVVEEATLVEAHMVVNHSIRVQFKSNNIMTIREIQRGFRCFKCKQFGHIVKNCPQNKRNAGGTEHSNIAENILSDDEKYEDVALLSSITNRTNKWFIDSGATKHMTLDRSIMINFVKYEHPMKIYFGDSTVVLAQSEGKVRLPICYGSDDVFLALHEVLFVPK